MRGSCSRSGIPAAGHLHRPRGLRHVGLRAARAARLRRLQRGRRHPALPHGPRALRRPPRRPEGHRLRRRPARLRPRHAPAAGPRGRRARQDARRRVTGADPHFLGPEIPITGDGRVSWGIDSRVNIVCGHVSTLQATDHEHLARAIELAEGGRGRDEPEPARRRGDRPRRAGARRGLPRRARRAARRARRDRRRRRRRPARRDAVRLARAVLPHRPHAAVHGRDHRGRASPAS